MRTQSKDNFHGRVWTGLPDRLVPQPESRSAIVAMWKRWRNRRRTANALSKLDERALRDIWRDDEPLPVAVRRDEAVDFLHLRYL